MTEALEDCGVDPWATATDRVPTHALWALAESFNEQNGESYDE